MLTTLIIGGSVFIDVYIGMKGQYFNFSKLLLFLNNIIDIISFTFYIKGKYKYF